MKNGFKYSIVLLLTGAMFSCVPQRKLEEEQAKRENCEKELAALKTSSQDCGTKLTEVETKLKDEEKIVSGLEKDTSIVGTGYRNLTSKYDKLNQINEQLQIGRAS